MENAKLKPTKQKAGHKLNKVLKRLMAECELDDAKLAKATQVPLTTIARMRACSTANPTASSLRPLSHYFGVSINQLLGDEPFSAERMLDATNDSKQASLRVPLVSWKQAMKWTTSNALPKHRIDTWVPSNDNMSPASYSLKIENNTYGDQFRAGTVLLIDPAVPPASGSFVIMQKDGEDAAILKEIIIDGNDTYLKSVNPELTTTHTLTKEYHYCGVVIESRYSHHEHNPSKVEPTAKKLLERILTLNLEEA